MMRLAEFAAQIIAALAADGEDLDRLALGLQPARERCAWRGRCCELNAPARPRSAVTAISRWIWSLPVPASSAGAFGISGDRRRQRTQHALHPFGVGTRRLGLLLRPAQLRRRHHLHGGGDLLRRLHAVDARPEGLQAGHFDLLPRPSRRRGGGFASFLPRSSEALREIVQEGGQLLLGVRLDLQVGADRFQDRRLASTSAPRATAPRTRRPGRHRSCRDSRARRRRSPPPAPRSAPACTAAASAVRSAASRAPATAASRHRGPRRTARTPPSRDTAPVPA